MPQSSPLTILIVNEHAEEIKLVTISLRGFFPDCRIDVAYSAEEAAAMATGQEWSIILIDDGCLPESSPSFIEEQRSRTPYAAILLQSGRTDSASALQALRVGADYFLCKHSPAFLTELLFCAREGLEKRDLRLAADRSEIRYRRLVDSLNDLFYELDAEGRFLTVSPKLPALLGYRLEELIGLPYHTIVSQPHQDFARFRLNERRSDARATSGVELTLQGKASPDGTIILAAVEVSARGLYDPSRRFLGTVGTIRDVSERKRQETMIQELSRQLQRAEEVRTLARQITELSRDLQQPLATLLNESQQLFDALRDARLAERAEALTGHASAATRLGERLGQLLVESSRSGSEFTINHLLEDLLASAYPETEGTAAVITDFAAALPPYHGDREGTTHLFRHLLAYAGTYLDAVNRPRLLIVKTGGVGLSASAETPTLFPLAPPREVTVEIVESDREPPAARADSHMSAPIDLLGLYRRAGELGAALDVSAPAAGPLRIVVRLPVEGRPPAPTVPLLPPAAETAAPAQPHTPTPPPTSPVSPERRATARVPTTLPAQVTIGSSTWDGTLINIGLGGACVGLPGDFPPVPLQEAYIAVRTAAAILELTGLVYERPVPTAPGPVGSFQSLVVAFHGLKQTDAAVLSSFIEAARERSLAFTLDVLLAAGPLGPEPGTRPVPERPADHDRREAVRVPLALTARLETPLHPKPAGRLEARVLNISRSGACLLVKEQPDVLQGSVIIHFAPAHRSDQPGSHEPGAPDTPLPARIVRSAPDPTAPGSLHATGLSHAARIGVRFHALTPYAERELIRVIRQHLIAQRTGDALSSSATVVSVPRECRNARGQAIAITDNHLRQSVEANIPTVIVAPGYGETASDYAAFSFYLAEHRFRVLRYDHTNHIGDSEGELQHTTLGSIQHDLSRVVDFVRHTWPQAPLAVLASDLAARAALKMAAQARPFDLLILVNPTIEVDSVLMAVHGHDLVSDYRFGLRRGISNLLGLNVNVDQFVGDLIAGRFVDLGSTLEDLRLVRSPLNIVTSPATTAAPVPPADLPHAFMTALGAQTRLVNIPTALTDQELATREYAPAAFKQMLKQIASVLPIPAAESGREPSAPHELARQRRIEQEYTSLRHDGSQIGREALRAAHVPQLSLLGNLHEYRKLLDDLYGLMTPIEQGIILADVGIGEGDLTRTTLVNHTYRAGQAGWTGKPAPLMVEAERSAEAVVRARQAVSTLQRELSTGFVGRMTAQPPLTVGWVQADWTESLPFKTGSLRRLVCNLSLSYVPSPLAALREWHRVLHEEGRLILTAFHPDTDLSTLYRRHLRQANQDEFSAQAHPLLLYFGRLREAVRHRLLHTFDQTAFSAILRQCGMTSFKILPIFDGQALVAVVGKRNSSSPIR